MIAIDVDSTLYDFRVPFRQAFLDLAVANGDKTEYFRGAYQPWVEWRSMADICGDETFEEALAIVHSPEVIINQAPFPDAVNVVSDLAQEHQIMYISNRHPDTEEATGSWLGKCGFPHGNLVCTMDNKMDYLRDCLTIIDDRPKTLCDFVYEKGSPDPGWVDKKAFGLMFAYNRALTDIPGIFLAPTWGGLKYYLQREGVLNG